MIKTQEYGTPATVASFGAAPCQDILFDQLGKTLIHTETPSAGHGGPRGVHVGVDRLARVQAEAVGRVVRALLVVLALLVVALGLAKIRLLAVAQVRALARGLVVPRRRCALDTPMLVAGFALDLVRSRSS